MLMDYCLALGRGACQQCGSNLIRFIRTRTAWVFRCPCCKAEVPRARVRMLEEKMFSDGAKKRESTIEAIGRE